MPSVQEQAFADLESRVARCERHMGFVREAVSPLQSQKIFGSALPAGNPILEIVLRLVLQPASQRICLARPLSKALELSLFLCF
jgi:hypothetical protein